MEDMANIEIVDGTITGNEIRVGNRANPEKDKFISQVINELGLGKESGSASMWVAQLLYNMAEKIAELSYEIKQIKEKTNVL